MTQRAKAKDLMIRKAADSDLWQVGAIFFRLEKPAVFTGRDVLYVKLQQNAVREELKAVGLIVASLAPFVHEGLANPATVAFEGTVREYLRRGGEIAASLTKVDLRTGESFGGGSFAGNFGGTD